jgi:gallate dioxygenase
MARIIGGLAVSHTPTIDFPVDHDKQSEAAWAPIFASFEPIKSWHNPDVLFYIFNDHVTSFFFDHYSAFLYGRCRSERRLLPALWRIT